MKVSVSDIMLIRHGGHEEMGLKLKKNGLRNKHKMHVDKLIFNKNILKASNTHIQPLK